MKAFRSIFSVLFFGATALVFSQEQNSQPTLTGTIPPIQISEGGVTTSQINLANYISDSDIGDTLVFTLVKAGTSQLNSQNSLTSDGQFSYEHDGG